MDIQAGRSERQEKNKHRRQKRKIDQQIAPYTQHTLHISGGEKKMTYRHLVFATAPRTCLCSYPKVPENKIYKKNTQTYLNNMRNTRQ